MQPKIFFKEMFSSQMFIGICALILFSSVSSFAQSNKTGKTMKTTKNAATVYLDKNDLKFISIKNRVFSDLDTIVKEFDPESEYNKLVAIQTQTWSEEKRSECQALSSEFINDYAEQAHIDVGMFLMVITSVGEVDQKKMEKEWEVRVQFLGANKYVAEFWEDGIAVNSEENAVAWANELSKGEYAKNHPDSGVGDLEEVKKNYANTRKSIKAGKQERYTKMIALLYNVDNEGAVTFIDPFQPSKDFLKNNSK